MIITRADAIRRVLWDPSLRAFGDFDVVHHTLTHRLTAATVYPFYAGVASRDQAHAVADAVRRGLLRPGGMATTQVATGQQGDELNSWAPLQYLAVMGLRRYGEADLAQSIATRWIRTNVSYYQRTGKLVEKYDIGAATADIPASGGEYPLQDGFGWTNGVLRVLLALYPSAAQSTRPAIYGFAFFPLLETRNPTLIFVAYVCGIALSQASVYGVQSTWFAELFGTRVRYTGASLPYQIAGIITSGPTPLIATYLFATYGQTLPISIYIAATGLLSLVCAFFLAETFKRDLSAEPEDEAAAALGARASAHSPHPLPR